jgi:sugar phosphate isomerase/epimerase
VTPSVPVLGVAPLSALDLTVPEYIRAAAEAGFSQVGLRAARIADTDPEFSLDPSSGSFRKVEAALADTGLGVLDLEVFSIAPGVGPDHWWPVLDIGARLGARYLNVVGDHPDRSAFQDAVTRLSADARSVGITPVLEPIAYRPFDDFGWAVDLARTAGCAVELDLLHFLRTGAAPELVEADPDLFPIVQLCDAPAEIGGRRERLGALSGSADPQAWEPVESRELRLPLGEGDVPVSRLLRALPCDVHLSVEIPNVDLRGDRDGASWLRELYRRTVAALAPMTA